MIKGVKKEYTGKKWGPSALMCLKEEKISLNVPSDKTWETNGWELTPLLRPPTVTWSNIVLNVSYSSQLQKKILESYKKGNLVPHFDLQLKLKDKTNPQTLEQTIGFTRV